MNTINYRLDKDIPVIAEPEVLIVGGGPGGLGAGVMAARQGARTMLVERYGCAGGTAVFGEITPFMCNHVGHLTLDRPVYAEWCRQMQKYRSDADKKREPFNPDLDENVFNRRISKDEAALAMEDLLLEAGVELLYHHELVDVFMKDGRIEAAVFSSKSGPCAIRAKVYVDSTGDGDLAVLAGAPFEFGNAEGLCQPMTTCFKLSGVDRSRMPERAVINERYLAAVARGDIRCTRENVLFFNYIDEDVIHFNTTRVIKKSGVDARELSQAEIEGRRQVREFLRFLRAEIPGFENSRIHSMAHHIGVRESRRILGEVFQTADDFTNCAKYPDGIAKVRYQIDIHNPSGSGTTLVQMPPDEWYELRYGTLIPKGSKNLLMGCRAISVDHALHSSMRIMPPVCSLGQAAGVAAAVCAKRGCAPVELDGAEVRRLLAEAGARL
ncbi:MAG: FAD-dependent oxidoreductase [Lentisphaeria bacterium]|nr:FAD-dependent oxidoreductase [Lentisphaeria bacterium]